MTTTPNRYASGKIYKLVNDVDNEIYVGSTCLPLHKRLYEHKSLSKKRPNARVYQYVHQIGWQNVKIVLLETYACNTKDELLRRERHWIDELKPSLNKVLPLRTPKEWREANIEAIQQNRKKYMDANREDINEKRREKMHFNREEYNEKQRQWRQANLTSHLEKQRKRQSVYYQENRDAINARRREARALKKAS